ncbi:response regulator transcription factor [Pseudaquabacterium rugosum]|uniref:Response regulator transcription factor n=1 Tax=Pseudaquabacterium rugosum TaxID=2984194 RepID=A0ABU9BDG3_9BURK
MMRVLLAAADDAFAAALQRVLERRGFWAESAGDGRRVLDALQLGATDVCLLDADLRVLDGLTVLRRAREGGAAVPVMVMAAASPAARRTWLEAGADDIVGKPFDIDEVVARLGALHRRLSGGPLVEGPRCGPLSMDALSGMFYLDGELLVLSPRERGFLRALLVRPGFVVPRDRLVRAVFGDAPAPGALDVLTCRLRRKLQGGGVRLRTVRGCGYLVEAQPQPQSQSPSLTGSA